MLGGMRRRSKTGNDEEGSRGGWKLLRGVRKKEKRCKSRTSDSRESNGDGRMLGGMRRRSKTGNNEEGSRGGWRMIRGVRKQDHPKTRREADMFVSRRVSTHDAMPTIPDVQKQAEKMVYINNIRRS
jgi:hypothetical protein